MIKKDNKLEEPLQYTRESFVNATEENSVLAAYKGKSQAVTFTLNPQDLVLLEQLVDRAIKLGKRNKSKSAIIRMALQALHDCSSEKYLYLYEKF